MGHQSARNDTGRCGEDRGSPSPSDKTMKQGISSGWVRNEPEMSGLPSPGCFQVVHHAVGGAVVHGEVGRVTDPQGGGDLGDEGDAVGVQQQKGALPLGVEEAEVHAGVGRALRTVGHAARVVRVGIDGRLTSGESQDAIRRVPLPLRARPGGPNRYQ